MIILAKAQPDTQPPYASSQDKWKELQKAPIYSKYLLR